MSSNPETKPPGAVQPQGEAAPTINLPSESRPQGAPTLQKQPSVSFQVPPRNFAPRNAQSLESMKTANSGGDEAQASGVNLHRAGSANLGSRDPETGLSHSASFRRKKSLVRPERERMDPSHRQWFYRNHAAQMDMHNGRSNVGYMPSSTGHMPHHGAAPQTAAMSAITGPGGGVSGYGVTGPYAPSPQTAARNPQLRRGKSILGREEDKVESGIHFLRRGVSMRRTAPGNPDLAKTPHEGAAKEDGYFDNIAPGPVGPWMIYCWLLTICIPGACLKVVGIKTPEQQRAWREKMGLVGIICLCMGFVGYITFGFTQTVCGTDQRYSLYSMQTDKDKSGMMNLYGKSYDMNDFNHTPVPDFPDLKQPVWTDRYDISRSYVNLLFPVTGESCEGIMQPVRNSNPPRYFQCMVIHSNSSGDSPGFNDDAACHSMSVTRSLLNNKVPHAPMLGNVFVPWQNISDPNQNLMIWRGSVIDLSMLKYLDPTVNAPELFNYMKNRNDTWAGKDVTAMGMRGKYTKELDCLAQVARVAYIDAASTGCIASQVELVLSMIFIVGAVGIKFLMALYFAWCISWRLGNYDNESYAERMRRVAAIENWTDDIYRPAPAGYRPNVKKSILPTTSRFTATNYPKQPQKQSALEKKIAAARRNVQGPYMSPPQSPMLTGGRSSASLGQSASFTMPSSQSGRSSFSNGGDSPWGPCPFPLDNVVPQPPADFRPFNFPLVQTICLVTAYSESFEGLRTTLDSLATTNYPNSHKLLLVIADGIVKGAESDISTPDICLSMMKELIVPAEDVEGNSYVAIADGAKRHNMAKVYAGFYDYDDQTVERSKQQRVPMILIAKCGTLMEMDSAKPGNRGKRDSQVLLMAFMQKVLFDERMTQFEYEFFNAIWRVTGVTPEQYEIVLMVDADTKVFPDSLTRMAACMVEDPEIMGLCGETKIANKAQTWVTMIQVFEYYISHHQTKGFEACFGGVTCLPGCFSAYRLKSPKGPRGFYVPILANPDIVEHYSENVVDTLHKKNLLLLGEDRYLTTLMLKTFPKRKMMFIPSAVCKTVVPDTFKVLRSQRRRWINSTVHNLFELIQVRDLCGTFCFSMRFVVFMDLVGTLVLPAAIAFTFYVVASAIKVSITNQGKRPEDQEEFPTIPLVLLGLILGLPGVLIVVTSRRFMYVLWMLVYLISLPIWNLVLPAYAYWHMDDFSWGATRVVQGEKKGDSHGDAEGQFDASSIVMKRWAEYERDRRFRGGTESRDTYDMMSPDNGMMRFSSMSSDAPSSGLEPLPRANLGGAGEEARYPARQRLDSVPLLELPAPLGPDANGRPRQGSGTMSPTSGPLSPTSGAMSALRPSAASPPHLQPSSSFGGAPRPPFGAPPTDSSMQARQHLFGAGAAPMRPPATSGYASPPPRPAAPAGYTNIRPPPPGAYSARPGSGSATPPPRPPPAAGYTPPPRPGAPPANYSPTMRPVGAPVRPGATPPAMRPTIPNPVRPGTPPSMRPTIPPPVRPGTPPSMRPVENTANLPSSVQRVSLVDDGPVADSGGIRQVVRGSRRQSLQPGSLQLPPFDSSFGGSPFDSNKK